MQVQVRVPEAITGQLDKWVKKGKFMSRSDAIREILTLYSEKEKTRKFLRMLAKRSDEAKNRPEELVPLSEV